MLERIPALGRTGPARALFGRALKSLGHIWPGPFLPRPGHLCPGP